MCALEDGNAANLISVDFEKAFNRMDHLQCLYALNDLGASFLSGRLISVKVRDSYSKLRTVPGGSPQGSILGNFLFCATTDQFTRIDDDLLAISDISSTDSASTDSEDEPHAPAMLAASTPTNAVSTPTSRGQFARFRPPKYLVKSQYRNAIR